jgi:YHS domain-containing protein
VNSLSRILRFLLWAIFLGAIFSLLRQRMRLAGRDSANPRRSLRREPLTLHRDPFCGTHVSPEVSVRITHGGQELHFCSTECRDRYLRSNQQATGA